MINCDFCEEEFEFKVDLDLHTSDWHGVLSEVHVDTPVEETVATTPVLLREDKTGKPDFTYVGDMYDAFSRVMLRFQMGEKKYSRLNFENAKDPQTYKESMSRHLMQYVQGQQDEDHLSAVVVNGLILMHLESRND